MSYVCNQELEGLRLEDYIVKAHLRHNKLCLITTKMNIKPLKALLSWVFYREFFCKVLYIYYLICLVSSYLRITGIKLVSINSMFRIKKNREEKSAKKNINNKLKFGCLVCLVFFFGL